jgi:Tat protein translocase TatB subunit
VFGIGFFEIIVIAVVALLLFGPQKLPEMAKQAGRLFAQLRQVTGDVRSTWDGVVREAEEDLRAEKKQTETITVEPEKPAPLPTEKPPLG